MSRKTRKLIWSVPLVAVFAVIGALAIFAAQVPGSVYADALPGTPTGLTAKADGRTAVDLSWAAPTDGGAVDGYRIDRSTDGQTWLGHAGDTMENLVQGTTYKDTDLTPGTDYIYRVFAVNTHGAGPTSDDAGTTTKSVSAPGAVRNLQATDGRYPTKVVVTWEAPADNGGKAITSYFVNIMDPSDNSWPTSRFDAANDAFVFAVPVEMSICATNGDDSMVMTMLFEHDGLLANVTHSYRVYASNGETASATNTQSSSDTEVGSTSDPITPSPVTTLTAVQGPATAADTKGANVRLYWIEPASNGGQTISGYRLHVSKNNRDWPRLADATATLDGGFATGTSNSIAVAVDVQAAAAAHQYEHAIPADQTGTWYYRVYTETMDADTANNDSETPLRSGRATASVTFGTIIPRTIDPAPTTNAISHKQIDLEWTAPEWDKDTGFTFTQDADNPATDRRRPTGYRVDVSNDGIKWRKVLEDNTTLTLPEFSDDEAEIGKNYFYRVFPIFASRHGQATSTAAAVTTRNPNAAGNVKNLTVSETGAGRINISWEAPDNDGGSAITGYLVQVYKNDDASPAWADLKKLQVCEFAYTDKGLSAKETRTYRVIALNKQNDGTADNGVGDSADTSITVPTNVEERQATTTAADLPPAPKGLTVESAKDSNIRTRVDRGILVYWNAPDDPDGAPIENYRVERRVKPNASDPWSDWEWVETCLATEGTLLYTHCTDPDEPGNGRDADVQGCGAKRRWHRRLHRSHHHTASRGRPHAQRGPHHRRHDWRYGVHVGR